MYVMLSASFLLQIFSASGNFYYNQGERKASGASSSQFYKGANKLYGNNAYNYNIIRDRYHPTTFSVSNHEHQGAGSESQVQYATFSNDGDNHEGEVMMHPNQPHVVGNEQHVDDDNDDGYMSDNHQPYSYSGGGGEGNGENTAGYPPSSAAAPYPPSGVPHHHHHLPPPRPYPIPVGPPPPHPPPHKSKNTSAYTYYYLGRHLWYIPLYFSIYFIVYVGLLVLKSIARHKIQFPQNLHEAAISRDQQHVLRSIESAKQRYFM